MKTQKPYDNSPTNLDRIIIINDLIELKKDWGARYNRVTFHPTLNKENICKN